MALDCSAAGSIIRRIAAAAAGLVLAAAPAPAQTVILLAPGDGGSGMVLAAPSGAQQGGDAPVFPLGPLTAVGEFGTWSVARDAAYCVATRPAEGDPATQAFLMMDAGTDQVFLGITSASLAVTTGLVRSAQLAVRFDTGAAHAGRAGLLFQRQDAVAPPVAAMIVSRFEPKEAVACASVADCAGVAGRQVLHGLRGSDDVRGLLRSFRSAASVTMELTVPADPGGAPSVVAGGVFPLTGSGRALAAVTDCTGGL